MVELAITLPILIMLTLGGIALGRVIYADIVITNAAREGAYYLSNNYLAGCDAVKTVVINEAQNSGISWTSLSVGCLPSSPSLFNEVSVQVDACVTGFFFYSLPENPLQIPYCKDSTTSIMISKTVKMMVVK